MVSVIGWNYFLLVLLMHILPNRFLNRSVFGTKSLHTPIIQFICAIRELRRDRNYKCILIFSYSARPGLNLIIQTKDAINTPCRVAFDEKVRRRWGHSLQIACCSLWSASWSHGFHIFEIPNWPRLFKFSLVTDRGPFVLHNQCHISWCQGDSRTHWSYWPRYPGQLGKQHRRWQ